LAGLVLAGAVARCRQRILAQLPPGVRDELLRVLISPSNVRADVIRQFHDRGLDLAEVLMDLEEEEEVRADVIATLRAIALRPGPSGQVTD
jgi:hypothetical protein